ncbi:MAG TPA: Spy/CpxP family protein refolding chaperone, partial [Bradyrhizobium sp.]|nr:Spy/CpxP family protein refolding chaperone [Bradyrhizobium sp.]
GGGGVSHGMGGGGVRVGGPPQFGGAARGGGEHFGGRFGGASRGDSSSRFTGRSSESRFAARPNIRQHSFASRAERSAGNRSRIDAKRSAAFSRNRDAAGFTRDRNAASVGRNRDAAGFSQNRNQNASIAGPRSGGVRNALNSQGFAGGPSRAALINPNTRTQIAASAATAGWREGRGREGWWRHRNGGYGWVGPLFWPFAYYDLYDYTLWGYGYDDPFWGYGYGDIYAAIFSPYSYNDLTGYWSEGGQRVSTRHSGRHKGSTPDKLVLSTPRQLALMCGEDSRDIAGLPIEQIQQAIEPDDAQRAALDELASASEQAAREISAACPTQIPPSAPARLAAMQRRIEAMISAVGIVQPALQKFYDLLNEEQKARLNALGQDQRRIEAAKNQGDANASTAESCGIAPMAVTGWPEAEIDAKVHLTEAQRASLGALQDATTQAAAMLKASCQPTEAITPPARLEAVGKRLDVMLQAVKSVRAALDDFYGQLSEEQKAQFEAIGPRRSASAAPQQ